MFDTEREGEINHDPALMREWSNYPIRRVDRTNIVPTRALVLTTTVIPACTRIVLAGIAIVVDTCTMHDAE